jgi:hypothetical protein
MKFPKLRYFFKRCRRCGNFMNWQLLGTEVKCLNCGLVQDRIPRHADQNAKEEPC